MRNVRPSLGASLAVAVLVAAAAPAAATTTIWNFEGIVRDCSTGTCPTALTDLGVDGGTPMTGSLVVDDSITANVLNPTTARYDASILSGEFSAGALTLTLNAPGGLTVALDRSLADSPPEGTSLYRIFSSGLAGVDTNQAIFSSGFRVMTIDLEDSGQDVITSLDMPTAPPALGDLDAYAFDGSASITSIAFGLETESEPSFLFYSEITSLTQTALPEPGTGILVAIGLTVATRTSRRSRDRFGR